MSGVNNQEDQVPKGVDVDAGLTSPDPDQQEQRQDLVDPTKTPGVVNVQAEVRSALSTLTRPEEVRAPELNLSQQFLRESLAEKVKTIISLHEGNLNLAGALRTIEVKLPIGKIPVYTKRGRVINHLEPNFPYLIWQIEGMQRERIWQIEGVGPWVGSVPKPDASSQELQASLLEKEKVLSILAEGNRRLAGIVLDRLRKNL